MIVVVGSPAVRLAEAGQGAAPDGMTAGIAMAAARAGSAVQIVGRVGNDRAGDALVLALAAAGVGHVALLRDAGRPTRTMTAATPGPVDERLDSDMPGTEVTGSSGDDGAAQGEGSTEASGMSKTAPTTIDLDAADVDLGLRYLTDFNVVVVAPDVSDEAARTAVQAAGWSGAVPISIVLHGAVPPSTPDVIALEAPADDADGAFADLVGAYAAALDRGEAPAKALRSLAGSLGWERAEDD